MAKKPDAMTLADLLAGQQNTNSKMNASVEAQIKAALVQENLAKNAESLKSENIETKSSEELKKGLLDKTGDGANANIIKMIAEIKKTNGFLKKQNDAKEVLGKTGDRREFKTIGQRIGGIKDNVKDFFTADGFLDKTGIVKRGSGGIFSEALGARRDRIDYAKAREEAGDPTSRLHGKEGARKIFERQRGEQQQLVRDTNKNEAKLKEYKDLNISDRQIAKSPEMKAKEDLAARWQKSDPSTRIKSDENDMSESEIEQAKTNEEQTNTLNKIEENTRPSAEQVKPKEGKEEKGGILSGLGKGMAGIGGALGGAAKGLLALAASVWIISKAFQNFATVKFSDFMMGIGAITALVVATKFIKDGDASKTLLALGAALLITSIALKNFGDIGWESIIKGGLVLGGLALATKLIKDVSAAGTLLALGGALLITSMAFKNFAEIDWETMGKGILAIGALTAAVIAIGMLGPVVLAGAATLLALGAALWVASKAFENVAESMDTFAAGMERIGAISGADLMGTAAGILAVSAAMAAFGAGSAVAGLGNLVSGLLSIGQDSPIDKLEKIAKLGDGLQKAADGLERIGKAMQTIGTSGASIEVGKDSIKTKGAPKGAKAPMTKIAGPDTKTSETVSGTLKGVTGDQIRSHPNFKKYLAEEEANFPGSPENYEVAEDRVKVDMVKEQSPQVKQVTPTAGNKVYGESAKVDAANKQPAVAQKASTVISAPTQVNNSTQNTSFKSPVRNQDNTVSSYLKSRYVA
jgi:hypothetical protein